MRRRLIRIGLAAVSGTLALGACSVTVGQGNPAGCDVEVHDPDPAGSQQYAGEISANTEVTCNSAPPSFHTEMWLYRSPAGKNQWEQIGHDEWDDPNATYANHDLHDLHIPCPGVNYDYIAQGQHSYAYSPSDTYKSPRKDSNLRNFTC